MRALHRKSICARTTSGGKRVKWKHTSPKPSPQIQPQHAAQPLWPAFNSAILKFYEAWAKWKLMQVSVIWPVCGEIDNSNCIDLLDCPGYGKIPVEVYQSNVWEVCRDKATSTPSTQWAKSWKVCYLVTCATVFGDPNEKYIGPKANAMLNKL